MKNAHKIFAISLVFFALTQHSFAQKAFDLSPDATVNVNDSVVIRLNDYQGDIQWQKSLDLGNWENILTATLDTLLFVADTTTYFRAEVVAGDCDPFYSDTTMVEVIKNGNWPIDNETEVVEVINPTTGKIWMDRNLGATRAATSSTDEEAYGDLYQWGRAADGHQKRTSNTTLTLSNSDTPEHGNFILAPNTPSDWRSPQNTNLWQGVNGTNNPCPAGYRLPTEAELNAERLSWSSNNAAGAFASPLKLPVAGFRNFSGGSLSGVGSNGNYWSSSVDGTDSHGLGFGSSGTGMGSGYRANGFSVRCLKDQETTTHILNINESPEGSGQVTGAGAYAEGSEVSITATANDGYIFKNWTGDTEYIADANALSTTLTMPAQNITLTANFEENGGGSGDWPTDTDTQGVEVLNPATGKIWMDRNLGATRAAISSTDEKAYGDLYQWGRAADGHQKRTTGTTSTLSDSDSPGHGNFILVPNSPYDWRSPQNTNLWQGVIGTNNPCPTEYRLPTEAELVAERQSWSINNASGAFASPLKLPVAGLRSSSNDLLYDVGSQGNYWSSTLDGSVSRALYFNSGYAGMLSYLRAHGLSIRCLKDQETTTSILNIIESPEGSGQVTGAGSYTVGSEILITAIANDGYIFKNWTGDTEHIADANASSTILTMPAENITLTANFEENGGGSDDWPTDTETEVVDVTNPTTGKTWMDRNLGASRAATTSTDEEAYGDLYQWGRSADGHQKRTSGTTSTLSNSDSPGHGNFILAPNSLWDWRSPQNTNLWQGVIGTNNPCPTEYRLPTEAELNAERQSWSSNNAGGALATPLKLLLAGTRLSSSGSLSLGGLGGFYWSSNVDGFYSRYLYISNSDAGMLSYLRAHGLSVRCIKD